MKEPKLRFTVEQLWNAIIFQQFCKWRQWHTMSGYVKACKIRNSSIHKYVLVMAWAKSLTSPLYNKQSPPPLHWTHIFGTKCDAEWMCTVEKLHIVSVWDRFKAWKLKPPNKFCVEWYSLLGLQSLDWDL